PAAVRNSDRRAVLVVHRAVRQWRAHTRLILRLGASAAAQTKETAMETRMLRALIAAALAAGILAVPQAQAQSQGQSPPAPGATSPSPPLSDQKLDAAAAALRQVASIRKDYEQRISQAPAQDEKERLASEGSSQLVKAVTDQGLSVEEYTSIMQVAQADP